MIAVGALAYDPSTDRVYKYGRAISLSTAPLRLLEHLMRHADRSFGTDDLAAATGRSTVTIRQQVRRIRRAIEDDTGPWLVRDAGGYGLWSDPPVNRVTNLK